MANYLLVGGDRRSEALAELLENEGNSVETIGLRAQEGKASDQADAVLFPYPNAVKQGWVPCLNGMKLRPEEVLQRLKGRKMVVAGRGVEGYIPHDSFFLKRYTDAPGFEERNAELSAEAAVCEAMLHSELALKDSRILITGYGLFGRALARKLQALGPEIWIAARREKQRSQAEAEGMKCVSIIEMAELLPRMDLILNTVPARIFGEYHLKRIPANGRLLELASAPYGFDPETAQAMGVSCAVLPGLPAKYSPLSAAMAMRDAVRTLMGEETK